VLSNAGSRVNSLNLPTRGEGIRVAVIDTGIDYTHPALGGGFGPGYKVAGGYDFYNGDADPFDDNGHGTHVAGIIAADSDSLIGVAPRATLYAFKVLNSDGAGSASDVIAGIEAAADPNGDGDTSDHVDVANLSLGGLGGADDPQSRAVDAAVAAGVVMCVAAGNSGGFAIIGSPGTARSAITVGAIDDAGAMTSFSSRGPSPGALAFKPDVVAPGKDITSTYAGGGVATLSGTSMATPHVTGACALLRSLHRDWSPADVKMALASAATPIVGTPADRGAGRVDAERASQATLLAGDSGLSFGLDGSSGGSFDATRSITLTNRGSAPQTLAAAVNGAAGATLTVTPASATLASGQSQRFDVHLAVDNQKIGYPSAKTTSGAVTFTGGGTTLNVPWIVVRSARLTVSYPLLGGLSFGYNADSTGPTFIYPYADDKAEVYVAPGKTWDLLVAGADPDDGSGNSQLRLLTTSNRTVNGDDTVSLGPADAPYEITFAAMDEQGNRLSSLPRIPAHRKHAVVLDLDWQGKPNGGFIFVLGAADSIFVSALPQFHFTAFETYMDADNARFFNVRHDELRDVAASVTLTKNVAAYSHSRWHWSPRGTETTLSACSWILQSGDVDVKPFTQTCLTRALSEPLTIESFITPQSPGDAFFRALSLAAGSTQISYIRAEQGATVVSTDMNPGQQAVRVPNDGDAIVGAGPIAPLSIFAASGTKGFAGAFGDLRALDGTSWALYDTNGTRLVTGVVPGSPIPAFPCAGCRIETSYGALNVAGHVSHGDLGVRFSAGKNRTPPTLTSVHLLDADGHVVDRLKNGAAATLTFSAAEYISDTTTALPDPQATRVGYRVSGTSAWHDLAAVTSSSESGVNRLLGRHPAGYVYSADLAPATALPNMLVDLQIELEDGAGNHLTWTQSPAFMVGDVPVPPRTRAVR